jgi:hypothetical protein
VDEMELHGVPFHSWMRWNSMEFHSIHDSSSIVFTKPDLYVQFCAPDDGRKNRLKHVEQFIEINRSRKHCILLVVLSSYTCNARTYESQRKELQKSGKLSITVTYVLPNDKTESSEGKQTFA